VTTVQPLPHTLDVRNITPRERHPLIFSAFAALAAGETLLLVNDHDPKPLYYQFQAEHPGEVGWTYVESGPAIWRVAISRLAPGATDHSAPRQTLDVREIAPRERHPLIFNAFAALAPGASLLLINDHDPKPLYYQLQAEHPGEVGWTYAESGPEVWQVAITHLAPGQDGQETPLPYPGKPVLPVTAPAAPTIFPLPSIAATQATGARWTARGQDTRALIKAPGLRVVQIAMRAGQHLAEHRAPGELTIQALQGQLRFTVAGASIDLVSGDLIALAAGTPHAATAAVDSVFLLTIAGGSGLAPVETEGNG
jgi:uncharacterized protein (DUF2249 family)/quercetin dioxygenase-like cupin family protein